MIGQALLLQEISRRGLSVGRAMLMKELRARELWPAYQTLLTKTETAKELFGHPNYAKMLNRWSDGGCYDTKALAEDPMDLPALVRLSERLMPAMRRRFLAAIAAIKDQVELDALAQAILDNNVTKALIAAKVAEFPEQFGDLSLDLVAAFTVGARYSITELANSEIHGSFDLVNDHAVAYAERTLPKIVQPFQDGAKELISDEVTRGMKGEQTPMQIARNIRDSIGLDPNRAKALENYKQQLTDEGVDGDKFDKKVARYEKRLLMDRSEMIARTEVHRASGQGQLDSWKEAANKGLINPEEWQRVWHAVMPDDGRVCDICLAMDGVTVDGLDGSFSFNADGEAVDNGFGEQMDFADAHVGCRCVVRLEKI